MMGKEGGWESRREMEGEKDEDEEEERGRKRRQSQVCCGELSGGERAHLSCVIFL